MTNYADKHGPLQLTKTQLAKTLLAGQAATFRLDIPVIEPALEVVKGEGQLPHLR